MGREVRMVPKYWAHPVDHNGEYIPLLSGSFAEAQAEWDEAFAKWNDGLVNDWANGGWKSWTREEVGEAESYADWAGDRPEPHEYMPNWQLNERTHLMMYETTSEGTPISPAFETAEELARWLADTGASSFGDATATYEQWMETIRAGSAPSAVFSSDRGLESGVAYTGDVLAVRS